jgi:hypothetical protein
MRAAADHRDFFSFQLLRANVGRRHRALGDEPRRHAIIGIGEVHHLARIGGHRDRGDHRLPAILVQRRHQRIEAAHLNRAGDFELLADQSRQIDVEAGRMPVGAGIVERRIVHLGHEADLREAREIGTFRPAFRIPETRIGRGSRRRDFGWRHMRLRQCRHRRAELYRHRHQCGERQQPQFPVAILYRDRQYSHSLSSRLTSLLYSKPP